MTRQDKNIVKDIVHDIIIHDDKVKCCCLIVCFFLCCDCCDMRGDVKLI